MSNHFGPPTASAAFPAPGARPTATAATAQREKLGRVWPGPRSAAAPALVVACGLVGLLAAALLPHRPAGVGVVLVAAALAAVALPAVRRRADHVVALTLGAEALALAGVAAIRDAEWLVALCLLGAVGLGSLAVAGARGWTSSALAVLTPAVGALRAPRWAARGVRPALGPASTLLPLLRGVVVGAVLVGVFWALFASADAAFAGLLPTPTLDAVPGRVVVGSVVALAALGTAYVAAAPPRWAALTPPAGRPARLAEWLTPLVLLDVLFVVFALVQLTVLFGGHDRLLSGTGQTYAEYAREGFAQLVVATVLVLCVVAVAVRRVPRVVDQPGADRRARLLVRLALGPLWAATLVVVASALRRMSLYEEAYGLTRLRLTVTAFELWLAVVLVLVAVAAVVWRARWLPVATAATAGVVLLSLAALDADALIAERNVARWEATGRIDTAYLSGLSADAVPALDRLPEPLRSCAMPAMPAMPDAGDVWSWNLGREQAREVLAANPATACPAAMATYGP